MKLISEKITLDSGKVISIDRFNTDDGKYQIDLSLNIWGKNEHWHLRKHVKDDYPVWLKSFRTKALAVSYLKDLYRSSIESKRQPNE